MLPYFSVLLVATGFAALGTAERRRRRSTTAVGQQWTYSDLCSLAVLVAFSGSRVGVGTDYPLYEFFWHATPTNDFWLAVRSSDQDPGFAGLQVLLKQISSDPQVLFWTVSFLTVVPVYVAILRASKMPTFAVFLFVTLGSYLLPFNVVRQGLAASVLMVAVIFALDNRRLLYLALTVLATLLHASALPVAAVFYLARNWQPGLRTALLVLGGAALFSASLLQLDTVAGLVNAVNPRYESYLAEGPTGVGTLLSIAAKTALVVLCVVSAGALDRLDRRFAAYALIGVTALVVGTQAVALTRLDIYFSLFLVLVVPNTLAIVHRPIAKVAVAAGAVAYFTLLLGNYAGLLGYESVLWS